MAVLRKPVFIDDVPICLRRQHGGVQQLYDPPFLLIHSVQVSKWDTGSVFSWLRHAVLFKDEVEETRTGRCQIHEDF